MFLFIFHYVFSGTDKDYFWEVIMRLIGGFDRYLGQLLVDTPVAISVECRSTFSIIYMILSYFWSQAIVGGPS